MGDADLKERDRMAAWLLPTLGYIVIIGATGVTTKLALRTISWQQLVLCVPIVYAAFAIAFAVFGAAAVFLSEPVTLSRIVGTILVVAGVVLISR
jgi:uncharacterized membrane protein